MTGVKAMPCHNTALKRRYTADPPDAEKSPLPSAHCRIAKLRALAQRDAGEPGLLLGRVRVGLGLGGVFGPGVVFGRRIHGIELQHPRPGIHEIMECA